MGFAAESTEAQAEGEEMMAKKVPYVGRKAQIRAELIKVAKAPLLKTITYGALGARLGIPARGPWKGVLDLIGKEEVAAGLPDVTFLAVNQRYGFPSQIDFKPAKPPSDHQIALAKAEGAKIVRKYNPGEQNPF